MKSPHSSKVSIWMYLNVRSLFRILWGWLVLIAVPDLTIYFYAICITSKPSCDYMGIIWELIVFCIFKYRLSLLCKKILPFSLLLPPWLYLGVNYLFSITWTLNRILKWTFLVMSLSLSHCLYKHFLIRLLVLLEWKYSQYHSMCEFTHSQYLWSVRHFIYFYNWNCFGHFPIMWELKRHKTDSQILLATQGK